MRDCVVGVIVLVALLMERVKWVACLHGRRAMGGLLLSLLLL